MTDFKAAIWAAVSTRQQAADDKVSVPAQLTRAHALCAVRGWRVVAELAVKGHSREYTSLDAGMADLPELVQLIDLARDGLINLCVCYDLNRFRGVQVALSKTLASYGCQLFAISQPVDPAPPETFNYWDADTAQTMSTMSAFTSDAEIRALRRRYALGMPARMAKGLHFNNVLPYGYRKPLDQQYNPKAVAEQVPAECAVLLEMKRRYLAGASGPELAKWLNDAGVPPRRAKAWQPGNMLDFLTNPFYAGLVRRHTARVRRDVLTGRVKTKILPRSEHILNPGHHKPLWSVEEWERMVIIRDERAGNLIGHSKETQVFTRLLRCGVCGAIIRRAGKLRDGQPVYQCPGGILRDGHGRITEAAAVAGLREVVQALLADAPPPINVAPDHAADIARLQAALAESDSAKARYQRLAGRGLLSDDDLVARLAELAAERKALEFELRHLMDTSGREKRRVRARDDLANLYQRLDEVLAWPRVRSNAALASVIGKIVVDGRKVVEIHLRD